MTQDNPSINPAVDSLPSDDALVTVPPGAEAQSPRRAGRWRRRLLVSVGVVFASLIGLVALTPQILSTAWARNLLVAKLNQRIHGRLVIGDWSVGWSGVNLRDVKLFDSSERQILQVSRVTTELSLLGAWRGQYHLGQAVAEDFDFTAARDSTGTLNFERLFIKANSDEPTRLPAIDGQLRCVNGRGTYSDERIDQTVKLAAIAGDLKISDINSPIENSLKLVATTLQGTEIASYTTTGTIQIARANVLLRHAHRTIDQTLVFSANRKVGQSLIGFLFPGVEVECGSLVGSLHVRLDGQQLTLDPKFKVPCVMLSASDGRRQAIGDLNIDGQIVFGLADAGGPTAWTRHVSSVQCNNLIIACSNGGCDLKINANLESSGDICICRNSTADLTYDSSRLWNVILPMLPGETRQMLKDIKVEGQHTKTFAVGGSLPTGNGYDEGLRKLWVDGVLDLDHVENAGDLHKNVKLRVTVAGGRLRIAGISGVLTGIDDQVISLTSKSHTAAQLGEKRMTDVGRARPALPAATNWRAVPALC